MKRGIKKAIKKSNKTLLFVFLLFLIIGIISGYIATKIITKNDTFELIGNKSITLNLNQEYVEQGVKVISYGKDLKERVKIESNLDLTKEGEYTIVYTIKDSYKYKDIKRVRYITIVNGSDLDE